MLSRRCHKLRTLRASVDARLQGTACDEDFESQVTQPVTIEPLEGSDTSLAETLQSLLELQVERKARVLKLEGELNERGAGGGGAWGPAQSCRTPLVSEQAPELPQALVAAHRLAVGLNEEMETAVRFVKVRVASARNPATGVSQLACDSESLVDAYCSCELARRQQLESLVVAWRDAIAGTAVRGKCEDGSRVDPADIALGAHAQIRDSQRLVLFRVAHEQAMIVADRAAREVIGFAVSEARAGIGTKRRNGGRSFRGLAGGGQEALHIQLEKAAQRYEEMRAELHSNLKLLTAVERQLKQQGFADAAEAL